MKFKLDMLAILGLTSVTVAQPLLGMLGKGATFFVSHGASAGDIVLFALGIYLLPALILAAAVACLRLLVPGFAKNFFLVIIGLLGAVWALIATANFSALVAVPAALLGGAMVAFGYARLPRMRDFYQLLGVASPLFVIFFLFISPVKSLLGTVAESGSGEVSTSKTPIVMVVFDELSLAVLTNREGEIDAGRLPNFSRLASMSTWYRNTTTVSSQTEKAVPAILSGMRPNDNTQPSLAEFPRNLFTMLQASHAIDATETFTRLCPEQACSNAGITNLARLDKHVLFADTLVIWLHAVLPRDIAARFLPSISNRWNNFSRDVSVTADPNFMVSLWLDLGKNQKISFANFLQSVSQASGPSLHYLHLAVPHIPWIYLPDGRVYNGSYAPGQSVLRYDWIDSQYLVDQGVLRYALQVEYVDSLLGQLLDTMAASGRMDEALLLVVSDHGLAFVPGEDRRVPVAQTLADVARVPLFIKYAGQREGRIDDRKIETIDIFPTIADSLGLPLDGQLDGRSVLSEHWQSVERKMLEAANNIENFEAAAKISGAVERIYRVVGAGKSAQESIGRSAGKNFHRPVPPLESVVAAMKLTMTYENAPWYTAANPNSGFLPARFTGRLSGGGSDTELLVALNGVFAGSGLPYDEAGRVSIMLDPRQFRPGNNELRVFTLAEGELREIPLAPDVEGWVLQRTPGGQLTVQDGLGKVYTSGGFAVGNAAFSGAAQSLPTLAGYVCDELNRQGPEVMILVEGDQVRTTGFRIYANTIRLNNAEASETLACSFTLDVDQALLKKRSSLSVVALFPDSTLVEIKPR